MAQSVHGSDFFLLKAFLNFAPTFSLLSSSPPVASIWPRAPCCSMTVPTSASGYGTRTRSVMWTLSVGDEDNARVSMLWANGEPVVDAPDGTRSWMLGASPSSGFVGKIGLAGHNDMGSRGHTDGDRQARTRDWMRAG